MKKTFLIILLLPLLGFAQALSGSYVIKSTNASPFNTLVNAVARINANGVSGSVTFLLDENQTVTSQITINQFAGSSTTNILTIKPNVGKDITVSGNINDGAVLALNNADNIVIDGNNTMSDNMLTIYNSNNFGYGQRAGIWFYNGSEANKIQNLNINLEIGAIATGILSVGIFAGGNSLGASNNNPNNTVKNVSFTNVKQAIMIKGQDQFNIGWNVLNNIIESTDNNTKAFLGIYILNVAKYNVSGNTVNGIRLPSNLNGSTSHSGIYLENANVGIVEKNIVTNVESNINNGFGYGIYIKGDDNQLSHNSIKNLNSSSTNDGSYGIRAEGNNTTIFRNDIANIFSSQDKNTNGIYISGDNQLIYNNFINDVRSNGGGGIDSQNGFGIYINKGSVVKLYYNTVVLKTSQDRGVSAALFIKGGSQLDVRNNIFYNAQTSSSYSRYAIYSVVANSAFTNINYNDYFATNIGFLGSVSTTLMNWRTATGKDVNSINVIPTFVSAADLHLQDVLANDNVKTGIAITNITTDIDNDTRAVTPANPYMGADEICTRPAAAGTISGTAAVCNGQTNVPYTVTAIVKATSYIWSYTGIGATIANETTNTPTITFTAAATSGNLTVKGKNNCGEGAVSASYNVTVNALPTAPVIGKIIPLTCGIPSGSVVLSDLTASATLIQTGVVNKTYLITDAKMTISGLTAGGYYFAVKNATCESVKSSVVIIDGLKTTTWTSSGWANGTPVIDKNIVFDEAYISGINVKLEGCSCQVNSGKSVIINEGASLKIYNEVKVLGTGTGSGTLTFQDDASLIQINDAAVNTGNIIYKRNTNTVVRNTDYTYWSTPVSPLNLGGVAGISYNPSSLVGNIFYSYEVTAGSEDWKSESAASPMIIGKGYSIRGSGPISANPLTQLEATFTGKPNNGRYPITGIHPDKAYFLGNPYPSALDANKFLTDNAGAIDGTLYFWTHSTKIGIGVPNPGTGVYAYTGNDYASYNLTGGTGTNGVPYPQGGVEAPSNPGSKPTGYIGAGQGFFAISNITILGLNEIVFNNSMRVGVGGILGDNFQFFKTSSTKSKTTSIIEKNRVWLNLTNTQGAFKQLLVGYITGASNDYDNGYDGETFDGNEFIDLYSINQEKNFVIQGRALPFDANDEVPLGYRSVAEGDFSISIDEVDGIMQSQQVYIEDKLTNLIHDLKVSPYDFTTQAGTFDDRFVLRYTDKKLGVGDFNTTAMEVLVSLKNKRIKINSSVQSIDKVFIYDMLGKKLYEKINVENKELVIPNLGSSEQFLIVKTVLQNGVVVTAKTIY